MHSMHVSAVFELQFYNFIFYAAEKIIITIPKEKRKKKEKNVQRTNELLKSLSFDETFP